jgi:hypothetical protein
LLNLHTRSVFRNQFSVNMVMQKEQRLIEIGVN